MVAAAAAVVACDCVFFFLFLFFVLSGPVFVVREEGEEGEVREEVEGKDDEDDVDDDDDDDRPAFASGKFNKWCGRLCWMTARSKPCAASLGVSYVPR